MIVRPLTDMKRLHAKRFLLYGLPALLYAGFIFFLSSLSGVPELYPDILGLDWILHFLEYYVLGYLLMRLFVISPRRLFLAHPALSTVFFGVAYGVSDEFHQAFVSGRDPSAADVFFDVLGVILASRTYRRVRFGMTPFRKLEDIMERVWTY
ncbi:MAG: VanZ family protein [Deltaproteobacteria bacterium]|nr:VanZ family protein [Deltaproteobacteria bacterium]